MNTPEQNIINTLQGKKVLFLENGNTLEHGLDEFERILKSSGINYTILFELSEISIEDIIEAIDKHDVLVFMTQWVYDIANKLFDYVSSLPEKKTIIECYMNKPSWCYSSQHGSHHDVYIYHCRVNDDKVYKDTEKFYKLTEKPYWSYDNNFDN